MVTCSPVAATTSSSRASGCGCSSLASAISRLVSPDIAEGTTTRSWPAAFHLATRRATLRIRSTEPTDVPPNFCTISAIALKKSAKALKKRRILPHGQAATHCDHGTRSMEGGGVLYEGFRPEESRRDRLGQCARGLPERRNDKYRPAALQNRG